MTKRRNDPLAAERATRARLAGDRGASAPPLAGSRRAANYRHQRAGAPGKFCAQLTPKQAKRLRKQANRHSDRISQYETAARQAGQMAGAEYDRMRAAQMAAYRTAAFLPDGSPNLAGVKRPAGQAHLR